MVSLKQLNYLVLLEHIGVETKQNLNKDLRNILSQTKGTNRVPSLLEEAKKRDHRKLGKELELFTFSQKVGQGLPLWLPKGAALARTLREFFKNCTNKSWI
jgi:threonyl-tRNA synthetase